MTKENLCLNCRINQHTLCANYDPECINANCPCKCKGKQPNENISIKTGLIVVLIASIIKAAIGI